MKPVVTARTVARDGRRRRRLRIQVAGEEIADVDEVAERVGLADARR